MDEKLMYFLTYKAKTPHGPTEQIEGQVETEDVGHFINKALSEYGSIFDVKVSQGKCPMCGKV